MFYLLIAILCSASMTLALKYFGDSGGNRFGIILGNYLTCILVSFLMMKDRSVLLSLSTTTIICGAVGGLLFVAGLVTIQRSIPVNGAALTAAFARLGLVVSLAASILLFGERPGALQIVGLVLVLSVLLLFNRTSVGGEDPEKSRKTGSLLLLLSTMLAGGLADTMAKVFERFGSRQEDTAYFLVLFVTAMLVTLILSVLELLRTGKKIAPRELLAGIAVGIPNYFSSFLFLQALVVLPAFVAYPVFSTGTIIAVMLFSLLLFRERPSRRQLAGIAVILAALVLLNL